MAQFVLLTEEHMIIHFTTSVVKFIEIVVAPFITALIVFIALTQAVYTMSRTRKE